MTAKLDIRKILTGVGTATLVVAAGATATAPATAAASSISTGRIQLCSQGNYASQLRFSPSGTQSSSTNWVAAGACQTFNVPGASSGNGTLVSVDIVGKYNTSTNTFQIGTVYSSPSSAGAKVASTGTTTSPSWKYLPNN
ncbi:hypothetical protein [Streptomyces sp. NPDC059215]|uniref:hypothetical protein n=1 Tax=Streptomyces sp. NPDC059215 TaxID=3346772 RepID=UPI003694FBE8